MTENLFLLLKNTVRVLIVDDEPVILLTTKDHLNLFPIYYVSIASTTSEALAILEKSSSRYHVCIMDRGLYDVGNNEFYLIDRCGKKMPFIVITAREDSEKGFECAKRGARVIISKGIPGFHERLLRFLNELPLKSIVCPGFHESSAPFFNRCIETLVEKRPFHVEELARVLQMSDRSLRNGWRKYFGIDPKYSLCIFHLYSLAFECIEKVGCNGSEDDFSKCVEKMFGTKNAAKQYRRFCTYYSKNRALIDSYIRNPSKLTD